MTKRFVFSAAALATAILFTACSPTTEPKSTADKGQPAASATSSPTSVPEVKIIRKDPRFDKLVPADAKVEKLVDGYVWVEGPVWNRKENYLLFSNIPKNEIIKWQEGKGASQFLFPSGYSGKEPFTGREPGTNGLTYDAEGHLVMCQHGDRRIARLEADGKTITPLAEKYEGKRFNSPNDLVYRSNGDLYFTDPAYGLPDTFNDKHRELDFCGVYRLGKGGKVTLMTKEINHPNGIAFSPDEKKLYVASSDEDKAIWMVYDVKADGTIVNGKVFFDATAWAKEKKPGLPDGMKVDKEGNLFATGPGGLHVFAPDGTHLGTFDTGVPTSNCAFGEDGSTLYITANTALLRVRLSTRGEGYR